MSWELPNDFKYGIYSDGNYLGSQELFKLNGVWWGLFEYYGELRLKGFGYRPLKVCSIQDLNDFKSYVLNNKGSVDWCYNLFKYEEMEELLKQDGVEVLFL